MGAERTGGRLPTFVIIGAAKSATTSLYRHLDAHPEIFFPADKEPTFFVEEREWRRGLDWYRGLYAGAADARAIGDASVAYSMFPHFAGVPERMAQVLPDVKLIYLMREPLARLRSSYAYSLAIGTESRPIREALALGSPYVDVGRYATQIERYLEHFDRDRLLLLSTEEIDRGGDELLRRIYRFIGVDDNFEAPEVGKHFHQTQDMLMPRRWWRRTGRLLISTGMMAHLPARLSRLNESRLTRRPIRPEELAMSSELCDRLRSVLGPEIERLAQWMEPGFDGWGWLAHSSLRQ